MPSLVARYWNVWHVWLIYAAIPHIFVPACLRAQERRSTDPTGAFCFEVVPGRYRVTPVISAAEERAGLLFVPAKREVTLNKSPVLDVNFGQALVSS
jgi:hypothetical protein